MGALLAEPTGSQWGLRGALGVRDGGGAGGTQWVRGTGVHKTSWHPGTLGAMGAWGAQSAWGARGVRGARGAQVSTVLGVLQSPRYP